MGYDVTSQEREVRRSIGLVLTGERLFTTGSQATRT